LRLELGDSGSLPTHAFGEFGEMTLQSLDLGGGVASFGLDAGQAIGRSGQSGVVLVELTGEGLLGEASLSKLGPGGLEFPSGERRRRGGGSGALFGLGQSCARCSRTGGTDTPTGDPESITGGGDHDGRRIGEGDIDRLDPATLDDDSGTDKRIEQRLDISTTSTDMGTHRLTPRRKDCCAVRCPERQNCTTELLPMERLERAATGIDTIDDDRTERLTRSCLEGRLPTGIHIDEIEQGAEHPSDSGETFGSRGGAGLIEC